MGLTLYSLKIPSPTGELIAYSTEKGICYLCFIDNINLVNQISKIRNKYIATISQKSNEHLEQLQFELNEYFQKKRKFFAVKLDIFGTGFQKKAWKELQNIQHGKTISYKQQAASINHPKAIRAIASANRCNNIPIIIPCHRVIGENGDLKGYSGGIERKKWLLDFEAT